MDGNLITVKVLINRVLFNPVLIDTGCECYSIVDKDFITELWFPRVKIPFKLIISFIKENTKEPCVIRYLQRLPAGSRAESGYREAKARPRSGQGMC